MALGELLDELLGVVEGELEPELELGLLSDVDGEDTVTPLIRLLEEIAKVGVIREK